MRGVAILLVVAYHASRSLVGGGFVGVDVFFVLSGYLITRLLVREIDHTGRISFVEFYARRARRLLPAAAVVVVGTLVAGRFLYSPLEEQELAKGALATALYISNFFFAGRSTDYLAFDVHANPLLHTWSLAVEEQFYLLWPLLILFLVHRCGGTRRSRMMAAMAVVALLSLASCVLMTRIAQPWAFFTTPFRAWEFALGGIAGLASLDWLRHHARAVRAGGWLGAIAIGAAALVLNEHTAFPGLAAVLPAGGTALILLAGVSAPNTLLPRTLSNPALLYFGRVSYSWYLWHWPALVFARSAFPELARSGVAAAVLLSLALASITNILVENPARYSMRLRVRPVLSLALASVVTVMSIGFSGLGFVAASRAADGTDQRTFTRAHDDVPSIYGSRCVADAGAIIVYAHDCMYGNRTGASTIVLVGDSHAAQWFPALQRIAERHGWRLLVLTKTSCPVASVRIYSGDFRRDYRECTTWRQAVLDTILALRPAAVVVGYYAGYVTTRRAVTPAAWLAGLHVTLRRLNAAGIPTLLLRDSPEPGFDVPTCLARAAWHGANAEVECEVPRQTALHLGTFHLAEEAASGLTNVKLLDLSDDICGERTCEPVRNGVVVYRDHHHLTATFVTRLTPLLETPLRALADGQQIAGPQLRQAVSQLGVHANE